MSMNKAWKARNWVNKIQSIQDKSSCLVHYMDFLNRGELLGSLLDFGFENPLCALACFITGRLQSCVLCVCTQSNNQKITIRQTRNYTFWLILFSCIQLTTCILNFVQPNQYILVKQTNTRYETLWKCGLVVPCILSCVSHVTFSKSAFI